MVTVKRFVYTGVLVILPNCTTLPKRPSSHHAYQTCYSKHDQQQGKENRMQILPRMCLRGEADMDSKNAILYYTHAPGSCKHTTDGFG